MKDVSTLKVVVGSLHQINQASSSVTFILQKRPQLDSEIFKYFFTAVNVHDQCNH